MKAPKGRFHRQEPQTSRVRVVRPSGRSGTEKTAESTHDMLVFEQNENVSASSDDDQNTASSAQADETLKKEKDVKPIEKTSAVATLPTSNLVRRSRVSTPGLGIKKAIEKSNPNKRTNRIGELLVELGQLTPKEVRQILRCQRAGELEPFGRIARDLGYSSAKDVKRALSIQKQRSGPLNPQTCWENKEICTLNDRQSDSAEAIRTLRARLMINQDEITTRPIAIVSPEHGEGRSYIASNLAVTYAQAGRRTLLIDSDLRFPTQHKIFGINNSRGFTTLATNRNKDSDEHPVYNVIDNLYLVPSGPITSSPQELLCRDYTGEWLDVIMGFFDVVILDTPPANHYADAELLAAWAGHTIMVTRKHKSRKKDMDNLVKRIRSSDTHIRGIVINE